MKNKLNTHKKHIVLFFFLFLSISSFGQSNVDTLSSKSFDELLDIYNNERSLKKSKLYLSYWIKKAKKEENEIQLLLAYELASTLYNNDKSLIYLDSILSISLKNNNYKAFTASAYMRKGEFFYNKRDFRRELKNYMLAKEYADYDKFPILGCLLEYNIGLVKNRIGEYKEALSIHKKNLKLTSKYLKGKLNKEYLQSIYAIADTYNYIPNLDSAFYYNKLGVDEALKLKEREGIVFFTLSQGITHYHKKQYKLSIDSLTKASKFFKIKGDLPNTSESYYFLGKSYEKLGKTTEAVESFKRVDSIFRKTYDLLPVLRSTYYFLIEHAQKNDDLKAQIGYTNQLIKLDSILHSNELFINKSLIKEYDIPNLISKKEKLISQLKNKEKKSIVFFGVLLLATLVLIIIVIVQNKKRKIYKDRFEGILKRTEATEVTEATEATEATEIKLNIPKETIDKVLGDLSLFEREKKYVVKNITLSSLAKELNTNTNYLSKIINHFKNESFSNYLNNLRIEYIVDKLKEDKVLRKFTIKAIADEAGFNNAESFSKAFYKSKGIKPSYFLKELETRENKR